MTSGRYDRSYVRPADRALAVEREGFRNWLYLAARAKGAFGPRAVPREASRNWHTTALARFFGMPGAPKRD